MDDLDIRERQIIVAWSGKVGSTIINNFSADFHSILVWNTKWEFDGKIAYKIGSLHEISHVSDNAIGIISCAPKWVPKALDEFSNHNIPTLLLSTWYHKNLLDKYINIPILRAPNAAIPIVELMQIFEEFPDFSLIKVKIEESHQARIEGDANNPWKEDSSGTGRTIGDIIVQNGGVFHYHNNWYKADEWISILGDITSYRWEASIQNLWVPEEYLYEKGHAYHRYQVIGDIMDPQYQEFKAQIEAWYSKYSKNDYSGFTVKFNNNNNTPSCDNGFSFSHNVNGRDIYADGLRQMLPWFLEQEVWVHEVTDYLKIA